MISRKNFLKQRTFKFALLRCRCSTHLEKWIFKKKISYLIFYDQNNAVFTKIFVRCLRCFALFNDNAHKNYLKS